jgi:hypothetical protein
VEISDGKPAVESRHAEDKEAGVFAANLNRLPLLVLPDGAVVGQSKAIGASHVQAILISCSWTAYGFIDWPQGQS